MRIRRAFTLIELLIVVAFLAIMAAVVMPRYTNATDISRATTMANNVRLVRGFIATHAAQASIPLSPEGFPQEIHADWFPRDVLPKHAWTDSPMIVEIVNADADVIYPASKVFDPANPAAANAWYNTSNGAFCVRIPVQTTDAATVEKFNSANSSAVVGVSQTKH